MPPWPYRSVSAGGFGVGFAVGFRRKPGANPTAKSVSTWVKLQLAVCMLPLTLPGRSLHPTPTHLPVSFLGGCLLLRPEPTGFVRRREALFDDATLTCGRVRRENAAKFLVQGGTRCLSTPNFTEMQCRRASGTQMIRVVEERRLMCRTHDCSVSAVFECARTPPHDDVIAPCTMAEHEFTQKIGGLCARSLS